MTKKYINTAFSGGSATFSDVNGTAVGPTTVICNNRVRNANVAGGVRVPMIAGSVTVNKPFEVDSSVAGSKSLLNESIKLQWNFPRGTTMATIKAEMERVLAIWLAQDELSMGLVPPVYEQFSGA